jgi:DNA mismatch endonuclease (patch repair protein)
VTDRITQSHRSWNMSRIRSENTKPERSLRSMLHRMGYRFRLHDRSLPGAPDIVLRRYSAVVFVHGCFWHRHPGCPFAYTPKTRIAFWKAKFKNNVDRDIRVLNELRDLGWRVLTVWECELREMEPRAHRLDLELKAEITARRA